jgi:DNA-3-methyladenine glycosylase II
VSAPYDPAEAAAALAAADPVLGAWIAAHGAAHGPCDLEPYGMAPFPYLLRAITFQQLAWKAASTIHGRVLALTGNPPTPEALLALPDEALRGAGLSRNKLAAARDLAAKTLDGVVPPLDALHALSDDALVERLTAVRGVGPWTVEMLLIFNLGRPDVLPVTDLGVRKGFSILYGGDALPSPAALRAHGECWRPWRSVASWYLWRAADQAAENA